MKKVAIILISLLSFVSLLEAQSGFRFGYGYGYFSPARNFQNIVFEFNRTHESKQRELQFPNIAGGVTLGWGFGEEFGLEFIWTNRHAISKTDFVENGVNSVAKIKYRLNSFNTGVFFPIGDEHRMGFSMDFAKYGVYKINCASDSLSSAKYENMFLGSKMNFGATVFVNFHFPFSDGFSFNLRPQYQLFFLPMELELENGLVTTDYLFKNSNFSIAATFLIGRGGN
ncbi:MAG: hypothetical protein CVU05_05795 [Bacteroidetes bacterium HGW-Bacteroidetes-21]|jgi:hypothetical protein|nr:MAG: hypothetical protein CVU05_05795 [Bacteroidetes bacterium HGW-Bacteroidetes-21]